MRELRGRGVKIERDGGRRRGESDVGEGLMCRVCGTEAVTWLKVATGNKKATQHVHTIQLAEINYMPFLATRLPSSMYTDIYLCHPLIAPSAHVFNLALASPAMHLYLK